MLNKMLNAFYRIIRIDAHPCAAPHSSRFLIRSLLFNLVRHIGQKTADKIPTAIVHWQRHAKLNLSLVVCLPSASDNRAFLSYYFILILSKSIFIIELYAIIFYHLHSIDKLHSIAFKVSYHFGAGMYMFCTKTHTNSVWSCALISALLW